MRRLHYRFLCTASYIMYEEYVKGKKQRRDTKFTLNSQKTQTDKINAIGFIVSNWNFCFSWLFVSNSVNINYNFVIN